MRKAWRGLALAALLAVLLAGGGVLGVRAAPGRLLPAGPPDPAPAPASALTAHRSGTAFLVAPGRLVTNAHVVLPCRGQGLAVQVAGLPGPWRVLTEEAGTDLALLGGPAQPDDRPLALSAATRLPRGMPMLALGYPAAAGHALQASLGPLRRAALTVHDPEGGRAVSFVVTDRQGQEMEVSWEDGLRYFGADKAERLRWRLEVEAPSAGGSSGGPLLDAAGSVVGVVYAGGRGTTSAVPLADLRDFLARAGVVPRFHAPAAGTAAMQPADWSALQDQARGAVHRITC